MLAKKRAPVGIENFAKLVDPQKNYVFVDRTPMIKQIFEDGADVIAFHTFRRGGKSLLASMLQHFFAAQAAEGPTKGMFNDLKIGKNSPEFVEKHQGQYPVIQISLKEVQKKTFEMALESMAGVVQDAYATHAYLAESSYLDEDEKERYKFYKSEKNRKSFSLYDLERSLKKLTELLFKHQGKKSIVIIDEYDTPLTSSVIYDYLDSMSLFMKNFLGAVLKTNDYLEKGILIGILRVSKESLLSSLNNVEIYTLLQPGNYNPYLAFSEQEVIDLFEQVDLKHEMELVKKWYNGYQVNGQSLYNPWSIVKYLSKGGGKPLPYWVGTANDDILKDSLLAMPQDVKDQFRQLIVDHKPVKVSLSELVRFEDVQSRPTALWGLLLGAGYITAAEPLESVHSHYEGFIRIPNQEIQGVYIDIFSSWLEDEFKTSPVSLFDFLCQGNVDKFGQLFGDYLLKHASTRNLKNEACYHNLLLGLSVGLLDTHHVFSDTVESGLGYPDMMIVPKTQTISDLAIVLEFKQAPPTAKGKKQTVKSLASQALQQIEQRQYIMALSHFPHITRVLKVGMSFQGKEVYWTSVEEKR